MDVGKRIKQIREEKNLTQQKLADALNLKQNTIATYEMGRSIPSDRTIKDICEKFGYVEKWLRTGEGPKKALPDDEEADYVNELLRKEETPLYDIIKAIMKTYKELDPEGKTVVKSFAKGLIEKINGKGRG